MTQLGLILDFSSKRVWDVVKIYSDEEIRDFSIAATSFFCPGLNTGLSGKLSSMIASLCRAGNFSRNPAWWKIVPHTISGLSFPGYKERKTLETCVETDLIFLRKIRFFMEQGKGRRTEYGISAEGVNTVIFVPGIP